MAATTKHNYLKFPPSKKNTDLKEAVLAATIALSVSKGFGNVTIDGIAKLAGLSKGGLLYHFPTKKELILNLLISNLERAVFDDDPNARYSASVLFLLSAAQCPEILDIVQSKFPSIAEEYNNLTHLVIDSLCDAVFCRIPINKNNKRT